MADAKVRFETLDYDAAEFGREQRFGFNCPKHDRRCEGLIIAGTTDIKRRVGRDGPGAAQWEWDGDRESPTFKPSIDCGGCWHGFIEKGRTIDCARQDEPAIPRTRT